jgi:hypothetical protein
VTVMIAVKCWHPFDIGDSALSLQIGASKWLRASEAEAACNTLRGWANQRVRHIPPRVSERQRYEPIVAAAAAA